MSFNLAALSPLFTNDSLYEYISASDDLLINSDSMNEF